MSPASYRAAPPRVDNLAAVFIEYVRVVLTGKSGREAGLSDSVSLVNEFSEQCNERLARVRSLQGAGRMGLGLAALGRPAYVTGGRAGDLGVDRTVESMRARTHTMLDLAVAHGVHYVDAARSYGLAEEFLKIGRAHV